MSTIKPSLPKGTRDFLPEQMVRRQYVFDTVREIFERYGYEPLETPAIEKLEVLSGKYGDEGEKLIFKVLKRGTGLEDLLKGKTEFVVHDYHELIEEALRYDLTVPLSRVVAMYRNELVFPFKRYQIQPVWRADRPQRGRYREFYQCDIDSVGSASMLSDAETIAIVYEVLRTLGFKNFYIRLNNRKILNGIIEYAGIPHSLANSVFIALDKLEKIGKEGVIKELEKRELNRAQINKIFEILEIKGTNSRILQNLEDDFTIEPLQKGARELKEIQTYLHEMNIPESCLKIDLYLARGLGYYTGPIHESVVEEPRIGSLTGGGRYDRLIGMFLGQDIPATGTAFGIERIIDVMAQLNMFPQVQTKTKVLVTLFDETTRAESLNFAQELRRAGVATDCFLNLAKLKKQFSYADKKNIPFVVIIGPDEEAEQSVTLKNMQTGEQKKMKKDEVITYLLQFK